MMMRRDRTAGGRKERVLIPDGEYPHALKVVRALGRIGRWEIHVCTSHPSTVMRFSRFTRGIHVVERFTPGGRVDEAATVARRIGAHIVLPIGEDAVRAFSEFRNRLPTGCALAPVPGIEAFDTAVDKSRLGAFIEENGLPAPKTWLASDVLAGRAAPDPLTWPVVCKPARGAFGRDMRLLYAPDELRVWLGELDDPDAFLVQQFARGCDIDVSVLCRDGEILASTTQQECVPAPVESFEPPPAVRFCRDEAAERVVRELMRTLDWSGVAHVDLRKDLESGEIHILEVNARFWGSVLGSVSAGVNMPHLACLEAIGESMPASEYRQGVFFTRGITGRLPDSSDAEWSWRRSLGRSNLPYVLRDPLPELIARIRRFQPSRAPVATRSPRS